MHGLAESELATKLTDLFEGADGDKTSSLPKTQVKSLLVESDLSFSTTEIACLMSSADTDIDGNIMYHSLAMNAFKQLSYLAIQEASVNGTGGPGE